jgi:hypothetical protein
MTLCDLMPRARSPRFLDPAHPARANPVRCNSTPVAESKLRTFTAAKNGGQIEWQPD